jgi:Ca2+:H+ antiporter
VEQQPDTEAPVRVGRDPISTASQIRALLLGSWINLLLGFVPIGFWLNYYGNPTDRGILIFCANFVAIIPLAGMLSNATEELAYWVGDTWGALLNVTFGYV